ncbi:YciI family protein [Demequina sp. NBRC 110057]|nr:YciI family protein [Demequina sp. NBRC 110057]
MPEFLLSVLHDYAHLEMPEGDELEAMYASVGAFNEELQAAGGWVFAGGLEGPESAAVVDATGDTAVITEGCANPSAPQMGGMWVIDVADREAALDWARRGSHACGAQVEVRPFQGV